jgi:hypothetical protein
LIALEFSQFGERYVTADLVTRLVLVQWWFGGFADAGRQTPRAPGVEHAAAGRVGRGGDLTGEPDPVRTLAVQ